MPDDSQKIFDGATTFKFKAFGLNIVSDIHCPELLPGNGAPDVRVAYGDVPSILPDAKSNGVRYQAKSGQLLLQVDRVARLLVRNGNEIVIDRCAGTTDDDVRLFLLGSAFGALLHQRGILPLHGCTIKVDDGCAVFIGTSGVGKSTLATVLRRRGYQCLGDDICAISIGEDGVPYAAPAYPQVKLWIDSLQHFGIDSNTLRRIRPSLEKRALPFMDGYADEDCIPVKRVYVLNTHRNIKEFGLKPVTGPAKIRALRDYTYRFHYLQGLELTHRHFQQIAYLASRLPVTRIVRPAHEFVVEQLANAIEGDFR